MGINICTCYKSAGNSKSPGSDMIINNNIKEPKNIGLLITEFDNIFKKNTTEIKEDEFESNVNYKIKEIEEILGPFNYNFSSNYCSNLNDDSAANITMNSFVNCKNNLIKKKAVMVKETQIKYMGSWNLNGKKEGFGITIDHNGNKYVGFWKDDKFHGRGRLMTIKGDYYEGEWANGIINGNGKMYISSRNYYLIGNFIDGKINGYGKQLFNNSYTYEGDFVNGLREGHGKFTFTENGTYEGDFKNDKFEGNGEFNWCSGKKYKGEWKDNKMNGHGEFYWDEYTKYIGDYENNVKKGNGFYYGEDISYDGCWIDNLPNGEGTYTYKNNELHGIFKDGKLIKEIQVENTIQQKKTKFIGDINKDEHFNSSEGGKSNEVIIEPVQRVQKKKPTLKQSLVGNFKMKLLQAEKKEVTF